MSSAADALDKADDELADIELSNSSDVVGGGLKREGAGADSVKNLTQLIGRQFKFLTSIPEVKTTHFLAATAQLSHMDVGLAEELWLCMFPRIWKILGEQLIDDA